MPPTGLARSKSSLIAQLKHDSQGSIEPLDCSRTYRLIGGDMAGVVAVSVVSQICKELPNVLDSNLSCIAGKPVPFSVSEKLVRITFVETNRLQRLPFDFVA